MENPLNVIDFGNALNISMITVFWSLLFLLIIGLIWFIIWLLQFKHKVMILEPIGDKVSHTVKPIDFPEDISAEFVKDNIRKQLNIIPTKDTFHKAKIKNNKGTYSLHLLFPKKKLKLPENVFQAVTKRGLKSLKLVKVNEHIYMPVYLSDKNFGKLDVFPDEGFFDWYVTDIERDHKKYVNPGFWEKYGAIVFPLVGLAIAMIIIFGTLKLTGDNLGQMAGYAKTVAQGLQAAADQLSNQVVK